MSDSMPLLRCRQGKLGDSVHQAIALDLQDIFMRVRSVGLINPMNLLLNNI